MNSQQKELFDNALTQARILKAQRRYPQAKKILQEALRDNPSSHKVKASLADLYYRTSQYRSAMKLSGEILLDDPKDPRALVVMGNVLLARKKTQAALENFQLALETAQTDYLWSRIARCHLELRQPEAAQSAIERGEEIQPEGKEFLRLRFELARINHDPNYEEQVYRRAIRQAPPDQQEFAKFVWSLFSNIPSRQIIAALEKIRTLSTQDKNPYLLMFESQLLIRNRSIDEAKSRLKWILDQNPPDSLKKEAQTLLQKMSDQGQS